jgi:hypothetical protein
MIHNDKIDSTRAAKRAESWLAASTHGETCRCASVLL